jgi:hypothetical protein
MPYSCQRFLRHFLQFSLISLLFTDNQHLGTTSAAAQGGGRRFFHFVTLAPHGANPGFWPDHGDIPLHFLLNSLVLSPLHSASKTGSAAALIRQKDDFFAGAIQCNLPQFTSVIFAHRIVRPIIHARFQH